MKKNYKKTLRDIEKYKPTNEAEIKDKKELIWLLNNFKNQAFDRNLMFGHITSSAVVLDETHKYVLMAYHNIYDSYAWLGGHADLCFDLESLARRETEEETRLSGLKLLINEPSSIEVLTVDRHIKRGSFVPSHLHYNVTYLYEGDMKKHIQNKPDENSAVKWLEIDKLKEYTKTDKGMYEIYMKSIRKAEKLK